MSRTRVSIIGVGLMGGSLGMALQARKGRWHVTGVGRNAARLRKAKALGSVDDHTTDLAEGVRRAQVVVLATPVAEIVPLAKRVRPFLAPGCLVMDIGSVKGPIVKSLGPVFAGASGPFFVGVHPMTGSEKTGVEHARPDLYEGAACLVTPGRGTPRPVLRRAESFWRGVGGRVLRLSPASHDRWLALVSHLPHLLADTLVLTAAQWDKKGDVVKNLAAGSFRDMTRVAGADPVQWSQIFEMNAGNLARAAGLFRKVFQGLLARRWPQRNLRRAKQWHDRFCGRVYKDKRNPV